MLPSLLLALGVTTGGAVDVVVFGDSWAEGAADELEDVLAHHGRRDLTVDPRGVGGTTAGTADTGPARADEEAPREGDCGCSSRGGAPVALAALAALSLFLRRR